MSGLGNVLPLLLTAALGGLALFLLERHGRVRRLSREVVAEQRLSDQFAHDAAHDPLTGLLNRRTFDLRLDLALGRARLHERTVALLFVDLDGFKAVNDTLGHAVGDQVLRRMADRLAACVRASDAVARFGGDEFTVLLEDLPDADEAAAVADRIRTALAEPLGIDGKQVRVGACVGVALSVGGQAGAAELLRRADGSMYAAKRKATTAALRALAQEAKAAKALSVDLVDLPESEAASA